MIGVKMEWLNKLFDIHKLPFRITLLLSFVSGGVIFCPQQIANTLYFVPLKEKYGSFIGLAFLFFGALVCINILLAIFKRLHLLFLRRKLTNLKRDYLLSLDYAEQAVLREFYLQGTHNIKLPTDNPIVAGLINRSIIHLASRTGHAQLCGFVFPVTFDNFAKGYIEQHPELIRITQNESEEWLMQNRPDFIHDIMRHDSLLRF